MFYNLAEKFAGPFIAFVTIVAIVCFFGTIYIKLQPPQKLCSYYTICETNGCSIYQKVKWQKHDEIVYWIVKDKNFTVDKLNKKLNEFTSQCKK